MVSHASRLFAERDATVETLRELGVRVLYEWDDLMRLKAERLARFARGGIQPERWHHLRSCTGDHCSSERCGAACVFAERYEIDDLALRSTRLLPSTGLPLHFSTIIDPNYFCELGSLSNLSLNGVRQSVMRRVRDFPKEWGNVRAVGVTEVSFERKASGAYSWAPHVHLIAAAQTTGRELSAALQPRRDYDPTLVGRRFRPVVTKGVFNLANALSYNMKSDIQTRAQTSDARGNSNQHPFDPTEAQLLENDVWLLGQRPRDRIILRHMQVTRGGLALRHIPGS